MNPHGDDESGGAARTGAALVFLLFGCVALSCVNGWPWVLRWLDSGNAPAWVQAVGSVAAIAFSTWIVSRQIRDTRRLAAQSVQRERDYALLLHWESFSAVATQVAANFMAIKSGLDSRTRVYELAQSGQFHLDELTLVGDWLGRIQPIGTPGSLVARAMQIDGSLRKLRRLVETTMDQHRMMDARAFDQWFVDVEREVDKVIAVLETVNADVLHLMERHGQHLGAINADLR